MVGINTIFLEHVFHAADAFGGTLGRIQTSVPVKHEVLIIAGGFDQLAGGFTNIVFGAVVAAAFAEFAVIDMDEMSGDFVSPGSARPLGT